MGLTGDGDGNVLRQNGAGLVLGVALVVAGVRLAHALDLVEVLGREVVRQEGPVLHPSIFGLWKSCKATKLQLTSFLEPLSGPGGFLFDLATDSQKIK